jgi:hypothetical protein
MREREVSKKTTKQQQHIQYLESLGQAKSNRSDKIQRPAYISWRPSCTYTYTYMILNSNTNSRFTIT